MKQKYRFVGTEMSTGSRTLKKFGDVIELTAQERKDIGPRAPLVHDALFAKAGFSEQELSLAATPAARMNANEALQAKIRAAWGMVGQEPPVIDKAEVSK